MRTGRPLSSVVNAEELKKDKELALDSKKDKEELTARWLSQRGTSHSTLASKAFPRIEVKEHAAPDSEESIEKSFLAHTACEIEVMTKQEELKIALARMDRERLKDEEFSVQATGERDTAEVMTKKEELKIALARMDRERLKDKEELTARRLSQRGTSHSTLASKAFPRMEASSKLATPVRDKAEMMTKQEELKIALARMDRERLKDKEFSEGDTAEEMTKQEELKIALTRMDRERLKDKEHLC
jgi:hypothetical protein